MSYRGRLTDAVQRRLLNDAAQLGLELTTGQIADVTVNEVDVAPGGGERYLLVDCFAPAVTGADDGVVKFQVTLDERTALRILFNAPLDETNVPRTYRPRTTRVITNTGDRQACGVMSQSGAELRGDACG